MLVWCVKKRISIYSSFLLFCPKAERSPLPWPQGDKRDYNELLAQFQNATPARAAYSDPSQPSASTSTAQTTTSPQQIKSWLDALVHAVSQLDDRHKPLVEAIASLPWTTYEESVRKSFVRFQCVLAAARPEHLKPILQKAVASLRWGAFSYVIALHCRG